jgi:hypothetical protein
MRRLLRPCNDDSTSARTRCIGEFSSDREPWQRSPRFNPMLRQNSQSAELVAEQLLAAIWAVAAVPVR